jgi:putative oxidoreductase
MKHIPTIASILLGLAFIFFGTMYFTGKIPPPPPAGTPPGDFFAAVGPTGYMSFVKVLEILGGILLLVPKTRNLGLLFLGPIIVNILCFQIFLAKCTMILDPVLITVCALAIYLLFSERKAWTGLISR